MNILSLKKVVYKVKKSYGLFDIKYMVITMTNWKLYFHWKPFSLENENVSKNNKQVYVQYENNSCIHFRKICNPTQ